MFSRARPLHPPDHKKIDFEEEFEGERGEEVKCEE